MMHEGIEMAVVVVSSLLAILFENRQLNSRFDRIDERLDARFDKLDERFDRLDAQFALHRSRRSSV